MEPRPPEKGIDFGGAMLKTGNKSRKVIQQAEDTIEIGQFGNKLGP